MAILKNFRDQIVADLGSDDVFGFQKTFRQKLNDTLVENVKTMFADSDALVEDSSDILNLKANCVGLGAREFSSEGDTFSLVAPKEAAKNIAKFLDENEMVSSFAYNKEFTKTQGGYTDLEDQTSEFDQDCEIKGFLNPEFAEYTTTVKLGEDDEFENDEGLEDELVLENIRFEKIKIYPSVEFIIEEDGTRYKKYTCKRGYKYCQESNSCIIATKENIEE